MGTWNRVGISPYRVEDLAPESREHLSASRSPEAVAPILLDPNSLDDLTSFLLDLESPRHNDPRYVKFRNVLLSSIWVYETTDGNRVAVLSEPVERFVRERISTIKDEDRGDLLALESELNRAIQTLSEDGRMARSAHSVTSFVAMLHMPQSHSLPILGGLVALTLRTFSRVLMEFTPWQAASSSSADFYWRRGAHAMLLEPRRLDITTLKELTMPFSTGRLLMEERLIVLRKPSCG